MTTKVNKGDYVVAKMGQQRAFMLQVSGANKDEIWGTSEVDRAYDPMSVTIQHQDVLVNLGAKPVNGSVYGVLVEPYTRTEQHFFGDVHWFYRAAKDDRAKLKATLDKAHKILKKHGLTHFFPIETEVRVPKGKNTGMWKYKTSTEGVKNKMIVRPSPTTDLLHTVLHEVGHGIMFNLLKSVKGRAQWVKAYHDYVQRQTVELKEVQKLLKSVNESSSFSDFKSSADERQVEVLDLVLGYISDIHNLRKEDVETLVDAGEDIEPYWPTTQLEMSDFKYEITEYAGKNMDEMFSECCAFYLSGKKLPKHITKLLDKTLSYCANRPK